MDSQFASKLETNYCPTDNEVSYIKALLTEPTFRLQRLDDEITELQNTLNKLIEERETLGAYVQAHSALISPARRLPLDIIQEIFVACLPAHRNCDMSAREAPMLLGRICSTWRTISLSTPRLWASLHIEDPGQRSGSFDSTFSLIRTPEVKPALFLEVIENWLGRSGGCPLSISLHSHHEAPLAPSILQALIPLASRWQCVQFAVPAAALEKLVHLTGSDVPVLESLTLHRRDTYVRSTFAWADLAILRGPNVVSVCVTGKDLDLSQLLLRWTHLTELSNLDASQFPRKALSSESALQTISRCPQLQRLSLNIGYNPTTHQIQNHTYPLVEHRLLQTLHFTGIASSFAHLLGRLSLPGLKDFTFSVDSHELSLRAADEVRTLVHFLTNSPLLDRLHLHTLQFSSSSLKEILRSLPPTLLHLHLNGGRDSWERWHSSINDDLLSSITPTPGVPTPCPALQDLRIEYDNDISDAALLRFITARAHTLRHIHINFLREMELDIHTDLVPFIENGLEASITHEPPVDLLPYLPDASQPQ
ncbi:hypothetical protein B0H11DRAFT_2267760 [Mycena galericulata]|nr:hypothetical protein B0H11DRAFT_2267760 [Mycena galericulata]